MNLRIKKLHCLLKENRLTGLLVNQPFNVSYLSGFKHSESYLLITPKRDFFITDFRYEEESKKTIKNLEIIVRNESMSKTVAGLIKKCRLKRVGFEAKHLPYAEHKEIKKHLSKSTELIDAHDLVESLRQIKDKKEITLIKKAIDITLKSFKFLKKRIRPNLRETDLALLWEDFIRHNGAKGPSFDIIIASGAHSSQPHATTSARFLKKNQPVVVDMGVNFSGYKSDLTRVFFLGKMTHKIKEVYNIVRQTQALVFKNLKPGQRISEIDRLARNYLKKMRLGKYFRHSLGHGVGMEVHEEPVISGGNASFLKEGMIFTIEPAVYLPAKFGIRLEDMVLITSSGCEVLSGDFHKPV